MNQQGQEISQFSMNTFGLAFLGLKLQTMLIYILKLSGSQSMKGGFPNLAWDG
ncbi:hypothetical protein [Nostoc sp.]|uniref:hypothetical protein n=1 Tax=Nostoc sp. TaxID=1180 RepID=UPI002FF9F5EB